MTKITTPEPQDAGLLPGGSPGGQQESLSPRPLPQPKSQSDPAVPDDVEAVPQVSEQGLTESAASLTEHTQSGLNFLRHAGIGARRGIKEKLSGEDITSLGSLEAELLGVLWGIGRPATSMDVMEKSLYDRRARGEAPVNYSTVNTTLRRLTDKGLLDADKGGQRTPTFTPRVSREDMAARILNRVSETLLGTPLRDLLPKLVGIQAGGGQAPSAPGDAHPADDQTQRLLQALEDLAKQPLHS